MDADERDAVGIFIRFWPTTIPPIPDDLRAAAQNRGKVRFNGFIETLGRGLAKTTMLAEDVRSELVEDGVFS